MFLGGGLRGYFGLKTNKIYPSVGRLVSDYYGIDEFTDKKIPYRSALW